MDVSTLGTPVPPPITHPLVCYLANDGNVWAINASDGRGYAIGTADNSPGVNEAPTDGQAYLRQNSDWTPVQTPSQGLVINTIQPSSALESTAVQITVDGQGFSPSSVINWAGYPVPTTFVDNATLQGQLNLGPGSAGVYTVVVTDSGQQSNSVSFTVNPAALSLSVANVSCTLAMNSDGDILVTQLAGPNAGKSVNLTYGKWI